MKMVTVNRLPLHGYWWHWI